MLITESVQGKVRWNFEQPSLIHDVPYHAREVGLGVL